MATTDKSEWSLIATDLTTVVVPVLPVTSGRLYLEIDEPGSGSVVLPAGSVSAGKIQAGMFISNTYRGSVRGGFFVENISVTEADDSEGGGRLMNVSGRGPLALLNDSIVWDNGTNESTRTFAATTRADAFITLLLEAITRGGLQMIEVDFSSVNDSNEVSWTDSDDYVLNVGTSLLDVARDFAKSGEFDIAFSPSPTNGFFTLSAYKNGIGSNKSNSVYFRVGSNCRQLTTDTRGDEIANAMRIKYRDGYTSAIDATSIAAYRRREKLLNAELAQTSTSAVTYAGAKLDEVKNPKKSVSIVVSDALSPTLFIDYSIGDTITYDVFGSLTSYRILGLQVNYVGDDYANATLELNTVFYGSELKQAWELDRLTTQWATARDNNLLEASFWASFGNGNAGVWDAVYSAGNIYACGEGYIGASGCLGVGRYNIETGTWNPLGAGLDGLCTAIGVLGNDVYVAVEYDTYTAVEVWDGSAWGTPAIEYGGVVRVNQLYSDGTYMYMANNDYAIEYTPDPHYYRYVLRFPSTYYKTYDGTVSGTQTVCVLGGTVYVGCTGAGMTNQGFAKVVGTDIVPITIDSMTGKSVFKLFAFGSSLAVGCQDLIAIWDCVSSDWDLIGTISGGNAVPYAFTSYLSDLYLGGDFDAIDGVTGYKNVAKYSGGTWSKLGNTAGIGTVGMVKSLVYNNLDLYVMGFFTTAGTTSAQYTAVYFTNFQNAIDHAGKYSGFDMGAAIHGASSDSITDSDEVPFYETVAGALRKITWANIKATLKTYFDGLYAALASANVFTSTQLFGDKIAFTQVDMNEYIDSLNDGYMDYAATTAHRFSGPVRSSTASYRRYYHVSLGSANPGGSGPTWVEAGANTTGGWRLTNASWHLRGQADIHSDWDGASDPAFAVNFMVNVNNAGGGVGDTVDLRINVYYKGVGDTATKTQAVEVATTVGQSAQYKQFRAEFPINWDETSNIVEAGDVISVVLNLETDTSEVDDVVITSMEFLYNTSHIGIESGDT